MPALKADIITQLKKDILALQGFRALPHADSSIGLDVINSHFPGSLFPLGVNHEFICNSSESLTASSGFIAGILSSLVHKAGAMVWISSSQIIFPPALVSFGINPSQFIFIHLKKDILWTIEEALKCEGLAAVVGEISSIDLTASRRLQLAAEQSRVTGFLLRTDARQLNTTAFTCRWRIQPLRSETCDGLPGIGFPRWQVELLKVRNGKPGTWQLEWVNGKLQPVVPDNSLLTTKHKQAV